MSLAQLVEAGPIQIGTLLSMCSAIALAVVGFVRTRLEDRRRYTLGVLMGYSQSTELLKALHFVREHTARRKPGEAQVDDVVAAHLAIILPHFQSIALAAKCGLLDRDIILSARYGSMHAIWTAYGGYVRAKRDEFNRPLLYIELEDFLDQNADRYATYAQQYADRSGTEPATMLAGSAPGSGRR
jgi:hypothetical protein